MPNIASVLKEEIIRLARKEIKGETAQLQKAVSGYRSEIAALKRRIAELEKLTKRAMKKAPAAPADATENNDTLRFRAAGFARNRQRLGLSAADMAKLLGVSSLSVYKWESGKTKPRPGNLPAIAALRRLGKKQVAAQLAR